MYIDLPIDFKEYYVIIVIIVYNILYDILLYYARPRRCILSQIKMVGQVGTALLYRRCRVGGVGGPVIFVLNYNSI